MPFPKLAALSLAAILTVGVVAALADDATFTVDPKIASMTADQKVAARQQAMKDDGKALSIVAKSGGGDAAAQQIDTVLQNFTNFPALFADGATNAKSAALPIIWTEFDKFTAILDKGKTTLVALRAAAVAGDKAAFGTQIKAMANVCSECHQQYRQPQ